MCIRDRDEAALTYAEVKALATGNPYIKEKRDLDIQVSKLKLMKANHTSQKYPLEDNIAKHHPDVYKIQLSELAESIKEFGIVTPIITRPKEGGNGYEVIAGPVSYTHLDVYKRQHMHIN